MRNLVTDVSGVKVGNATDHRLRSGVTAVVFDRPAVASVDVRGGAPGTRETDLLAPERTVERVDAIVLSGGSAFGLDAASGAMAALAAAGRGFAVGPARVPIVPAAILFDLLNGGDKAWGAAPPYRAMGFEAVTAAADSVDLGSVGAAAGATIADLRGGLGSASTVTSDGHVIGAVVAVNALGRVTMGRGPWFWAAPFEEGAEFGGHGLPPVVTPEMREIVVKGGRLESTTIAVVATDATLTKAQCRHLAVMAQDGLARAIYPVHTVLDGDTVFAAATGEAAPLVDLATLTRLGASAANVLARAVARGVYAAATDDRGATTVPAYRTVWG